MKYKWCAAWCAVFFLLGGSFSQAETLHTGRTPPVAEQSAAAAPAVKMAVPETKAAGKEAKTPAKAVAAEETLRPISSLPLYEIDFTIRGISLGQNAGTVTFLAGKPEKEEQGAVRSEYQWKDLAVRMVNDLAYKYESRGDVDMPDRGVTGPGVEAIAVTGPSVMTPRGLTVGSSRENVLRVYGRPARILWDGPKSVFYMVYDKGEKSLVFTIGNNKVERILVTRKDPQFEGNESRGLYGKRERMEDNDFHIAGFALNTPFHEYTWLVWEKKAMNPEEEVWYYPGFAVRMDKKTHTIEASFLTDARMLTYRGIAIGDHLSTLEAMYGAPEKLEMNTMEGHPQSAYIYFSPDKQQVLIFYVDDQSKTVQNVLVMENPQMTSPFQSALDAIHHVRAKNHAEKVH